MGQRLYVSQRNGPTIPVKVTETDFLKTFGGGE
ncbi:MAG: hypothetical protein R3D33_14350 [Hyphomicrobiaceae bacterium]